MTREMCIRVIASTTAFLLATSLWAGQAQRFPNRIKYKDTSMKSATGRAGSATVTARALLGQDHVTDLEITTGELDSTVLAPGAIEKVQIKLTAGSRTVTTNYNKQKNGGGFALSMPGMARHETFEMTTHVSGIDRNRTGVVTLQETVKLRPDLSIGRLQVPDRAAVGAPVQLTAEVSEINGDVGARADCVLLVDGNLEDEARGIWVNSGSAVSCTFIHRFTTPGPKQIQIVARQVTPRDFSEANNTATATLTVSQPGTPFMWGQADAGEYYQRFDVWQISPPSNSGELSNVFNDTWWFIQAGSWVPTAGEVISASVRVSTAGLPLHSMSLTLGPNIGWAPGFIYRQGIYVDDELGVSLQAYTYTFEDGTGYTGLDASWSAGDATYYSRQWSCTYWECTPADTYTVQTRPFGTMAPLGSTVEIVATVEGDRTFVADVVIPLDPEQSEAVSQYPCWENWWHGSICQEYKMTEHGRLGRVDWYNP